MSRRLIFLAAFLIFFIGCFQTNDETPVASPALPTQAVAVATMQIETPTAEPTDDQLPPTWTPDPLDLITLTPAGQFVPTERPPATPWPTVTNTPIPTNTPVPTAAPPTVTPIPATSTPAPTVIIGSGPNLLPNPSFEGGWRHPNGDPELQIPDNWRFEFTEGDNSLDPDPWNKWVRPEVRVLSPDFLPAREHDLFIWDGQQTLKVFKGQGAINYRLLTEVDLEPGRYRLTIRVFPDLVMGYSSMGGKIWADDPLAGEVSLWAASVKSPWYLPSFGRRNEFTQEFELDTAQRVTVGVAVRGRWAIENNGWFFDDLRLEKVG